MNYKSLTRRNFLKQATTLGASLFVLSPAQLLADSLTKNHISQETRLLMGTIVNITAKSQSKIQAETAIGLAFNEIERLIDIFNRHSSSSVIGTLNAQGKIKDIPVELSEVLTNAQKITLSSNEMFNPTIEPLLRYYETHKTNSAKLNVSSSEIKELRELADLNSVKINASGISFAKQGMGITLDGIAKGYITDMAAKVLEKNQVHDYMINAGGDIKVSGTNIDSQSWNIGIANPYQKGQSVETIRLNQGAIASSGGSENFFDSSKQNNHLINPYTGKSPNIASVSVVAPNTMLADALATTIALLPTSSAIKLINQTPNTACLILENSGERFTSATWNQLA
ncbi:FAD:protein FMN transferase [Desulfovibrio litoralis]|uniref:FAD:protein FMN transferase n=1 Tax=Desulfovibrio litoralis DSM 11393 TaxID=1121455 RepID=A0A1M7SEJ5_9BACT|nr:FAD:protein FMN transferase [Desulfovibrio litoralis]SHN56890.1 thiamine biosynthesis lipoprotein [Desulfovibrio litoralis DSM 11393]